MKELRSLEETAYLMASPRNAERLDVAIRELNHQRGKNTLIQDAARSPCYHAKHAQCKSLYAQHDKK